MESQERFDTEEEREYLSPPLSPLQGTMLLSCLADLKSAEPSICVGTRARLQTTGRPARRAFLLFLRVFCFLRSCNFCQQPQEDLKTLLRPFDHPSSDLKRINRR